jgi:exonuclease III
MKLISWNCRGLGNATAVRALKKLIKDQTPDIVFLMETKLKTNDPNIYNKVFRGCLHHYFLVSCEFHKGNRSGGLAILWNHNVKINISSIMVNNLNVYIMIPKDS